MEEKKEEGASSMGGCGMNCGCRACKTIKGLVLFLIGGFFGFMISQHRYSRWMSRMCPMEVAAPERMESASMPQAPGALKNDK
jgi:hypothetical protein